MHKSSKTCMSKKKANARFCDWHDRFMANAKWQAKQVLSPEALKAFSKEMKDPRPPSPRSRRWKAARSAT